MQRLILFLFATALYLPSVGYDFAYDDTLQITLNPQVTSSRDLTTATQEIFLSPTPPGNLYRPLTTLSYFMNRTGDELTPAPFHFINVIIYGLISLLIYELFLQVFSDTKISFVASLLFIAHPLHTEAVGNIVGRAELLSTLFGLLALHIFNRSLNSNWRSLWATISGITFLLACFSKESAILLLPLILIFPYIFKEKNFIELIKAIPGATALTGAAVLSLALRYTALGPNFILHQDQTIWPENPIFNFSFIDRIIPSIFVLGSYIRMLILPLWQSADYSMMPNDFLAKVYSSIGTIQLILPFILAFLTWHWRKQRFAFFGLWFFLTFALTINLLTPIGTIIGERLAFLPSVGFVGFAVGMAVVCIKDKRQLRALGCGVILAFSLLTWKRLPIWQNNQVLFKQTISDAPQSPKSYYNYGVYLYSTEKNLPEAENSFRKALEIHPTYVLPARVMTDIMLAKKDWGRLEYWYLYLLKLTPDDKEVQKNLAELKTWKNQPK